MIVRKESYLGVVRHLLTPILKDLVALEEEDGTVAGPVGGVDLFLVLADALLCFVSSFSGQSTIQWSRRQKNPDDTLFSGSLLHKVGKDERWTDQKMNSPSSLNDFV